MVALTDRVVANGDLLSTEIDGETVMMNMDSGQYYALNDVGSRIWQELANPVEVDGLCRRLEAEYDAEAGVIRDCVLRFLTEMLDKRLIRIEP